MAIYKTRNTGMGNGMRGMRGMGGMLYSGECRETFWGTFSNILGNVAKLLSLLVSECFTVHYVLISSNQSEYLYSFPVCKNALPANAKETF